MPATSLLAEFRRRIRDVRYAQRAFTLALLDPNPEIPVLTPPVLVPSAIAEVGRGRLLVTVSNVPPGVPDLNVDLSHPHYDTVGKLCDVLSRTKGYRATLTEGANPDHPSMDLEGFGPTNIVGTGVVLCHHLFSDMELEDILRQAIQRHNPSLDLISIPQQETVFAFQLAHASVLREQAADAAKRRGLDADVSSLLQLADSYERAYQTDTLRLRRAIQSPKEAAPNRIGTGDVVLGTLTRMSARTGYMTPLSSNPKPEASELLEPSDIDIEDDNLKITWERSRERDFYSYELWMDTRPEVVRSGELVGDATMVALRERPVTSKMVFRSLGPNTHSFFRARSAFVEQLGESISGYIVADLEPETEYFFRLYVADLNYEQAASEVRSYRTKPLRAKFDPVVWGTPAYGPPGTVVTLRFDRTKGAVTAGHKVLFGGKEVALTVVDDWTARVTVPSFTQKADAKDVTIISPSGLFDVKNTVFKVT
jgi:hypothetical protein